MHYNKMDIVFQEVPDEISLVFSIVGCPLRCEGCHAASMRSDPGKLLTKEVYENKIDMYRKSISCVLFFGGEWHESQLIEYLKIAQDKGLKTCLYTGLTDVSDDLKANLDYLKVGPWVSALGGLDSKNTNQVFYHVKTNTILNDRFQEKKITND